MSCSNLVYPNMLNDRSTGLALAGMPSVCQRRPSRLGSLTVCLVSTVKAGLRSAAEPDEARLDVRHVVNKRKRVEDGV